MLVMIQTNRCYTRTELYNKTTEHPSSVQVFPLEEPNEVKPHYL